MTIAVAPFSKFLAVLVAVPSPVVSVVYVIIFGMLFVEGAKVSFSGQVDQKKATTVGVSMVLGLSAGILSGLAQGIGSQLVGNTIVVVGIAAIGMTLFTEVSGLRTRRLRVELSRSSLPAVDDFLSRFADAHLWTEERKNRLRSVGEEVVLSLLEEQDIWTNPREPENGVGSAQKRLLVAAIRPESGCCELEILVAADGAIQGNIEDRMACLGEEQALEEELELSVRTLRHYASSVNHWKY